MKYTEVYTQLMQKQHLMFIRTIFVLTSTICFHYPTWHTWQPTIYFGRHQLWLLCNYSFWLFNITYILYDQHKMHTLLAGLTYYFLLTYHWHTITTHNANFSLVFFIQLNIVRYTFFLANLWRTVPSNSVPLAVWKWRGKPFGAPQLMALLGVTKGRSNNYYN